MTEAGPSRGEIRREEILLAALDTMWEQGIYQFSMERVAVRIGVAKSTIYKYFLSKDDLFARLFLDFYHDLFIKLEPIDEIQSVIPFLRQLVRNYFHYHLVDERKAQLITKCKHLINIDNLSPALFEEFSNFRSQRQDYLAAVLSRGMQEGMVRHLPIADVADFGIRFLDSVLYSIYELGSSRQQQDFDELQKIAEDMLVRGILNL